MGEFICVTIISVGNAKARVIHKLMYQAVQTVRVLILQHLNSIHVLVYIVIVEMKYKRWGRYVSTA